MQNEVKVFGNADFNVQVRIDKNGNYQFDAESVAISLGLTTVAKSGNVCVRWKRVNEYLKLFGTSAELARGSYIPEPAVYKLAFKANNEVAESFQDWLSVEVLPALRKTGYYEMPKKLSATEQLRLQNQAILEVDEKVEAVNQDLQQFKQDMPILGIEEDRITNAVKKKGVQCLGGKNSNAYKDHSLRQRIYRDIYRELYRQFGVSTYKAIKRSQCDIAVSIIDGYEPPLILAEQISDCNAQINISQEVA